MNDSNFLNTSHQTLKWFADQNTLGTLELRPGFQRRPVWSDDDKAFLIDSILRGYPVPEVYVQSVDDGTNQTVAVVDGQQRLRACLEFIEGRYSLVFDVDKLEPMHSLEDTPWFNKTFSELADEEQLRIRKYKLIVRDLEDADEGQVRHLFHRLNQSNVALNPQELRYSMYKSGLLGFVEEMIQHDAWEHIRLFTKQQQRRMLDSEYVSELVVGHLHFPQNKKDDLDHYYRQYATRLPGEAQVREAFERTLDAIIESFPQPHMDRTRWYKKSDFYTLFLAISRGRLPLTNGSLAQYKSRLIEFARLVDLPPQIGEARAVTVYREAVSRAATDRSRRVKREQALLSYLLGTELLDEALPITDLSVDSEADEEYADQTPTLGNI